MRSSWSLRRRFAIRAPSAATSRRTPAAGTTAAAGPAIAPAATSAMPIRRWAATASTPSSAPTAASPSILPTPRPPSSRSMPNSSSRRPRARSIVNAEDYFLGPEIDITRLNILQPGDLLTAIRIPSAWAGAKFYFEKVRDRNVWDFALMNVASAMVLSGGNIDRIRIAVSAVAPQAPCASRPSKMQFAASPPTRPPAKWPANSPFRARSRCSSTPTRFR